MPLPFPQRTIDAVAACTRTLAASPHADVGLDRADAGSLGAFRAVADRSALTDRHHDAAVHRRHAPDDAAERLLYDAVALARLDAFGVRWLPGIRQNLLAHPGSAHDGPRWLAFELFSRETAPATKVAPVARARAALSPAALQELAGLAACLDTPAAFAARAAAWARTAAPQLAPAVDPVETGRGMAIPARQVHRDARRPSRAGGNGGPRRRRSNEQDASQQAGGPSTAGGPARTPAGGAPERYRAYTTACDRVVDAAALATRDELLRLHGTLDTQLASLRTVVARLAKRLLRVLMARQTRQWRFDVDEGFLDGGRLSALVASGGRVRPFREESESPFPDTVVTLLIDHSGSMRGRPMQIAALTVEIFARVLERCGVRCEVLGFTTRDWNGGEPARRWEADGYPDAPGRLNAIEHIVIKSANVPWRRARAGLGLFLRDEMLKENIDGEAVAWAHTRLLARAEPRRILVVVSDGTPMDEATCAANGFEYLDDHLAQVVDDIETRSPVQLAAIGIGHDVSRFYRNATRIARIDDLGPALTATLIALLEDPDASPRGRRRPRPALSRR
jgi:cobaltochelatase CobT